MLRGMVEQICDQLAAAQVQHIGKMLVVWRPSDKQRIVLPKSKKELKTKL